MTTRQSLAYALIEQFVGVTMPVRGLKSPHLGLYTFLVHLWAVSNQEHFALNDSFVAGSLNCDERTMVKMREELEEAGIIHCVVNVVGKKQKRTQYVFNETLAEQAYQFHTGNALQAARQHTPQELSQKLQQNLFSDVHTTNSSTQEKKMGGDQPDFCATATTDTLPEPEPLPETEPVIIHTHARPKLSDVLLEMTEIVKRDSGVNDITPLDAEIINAIANKFLSSWNAKEWTDLNKATGRPYSIIRWWRERAIGYYYSCYGDVSASLLNKCRAKNNLATQAANEKQKQEYFAEVREKKFSESPQAASNQTSNQGKPHATHSTNPSTGFSKPNRNITTQQVNTSADANDWLQPRKTESGVHEYSADPQAIITDFALVGAESAF